MKKYLNLFLLLIFLQPSWSQNSLKNRLEFLYRHEKTREPKQFEFEVDKFIRESQQYEQLPESKKIKKITSDIEKRFFDTYVTFSTFSEIEGFGIYSPVTATILTALIFDELNIPFKIKVAHNAISILTYPKTKSVEWSVNEKIETLYYWTENSASLVLFYMERSNVITETQMEGEGATLILQHYFSQTKEISLDELLGIYYFNEAMHVLDDKNYEKAYQWINVAQSKYDHPPFEYLERAVLNEMIIKMEKADIKLPKYITALYAMTRDQVTKEKLLEHFKFIYRDAVIEREDSIFATITEEAVNKYLTDHEDYRLFLGHIEFMKAYKHSLKGRMRESVKLLKKSIALVPENKYYADVLGSALVSEAIKYNLELQEITDSTSVYLEKYPFLLEDTDYTSFVFQYYCTVVVNLF